MPSGCCRRRCCRRWSARWRPGRSAAFAIREVAMADTVVDVNHVSRSFGQKAGGMTLGSPIVAMLWEIWRVTRVEVAWKLAFGIVGPLAVLALSAAFAPADNATRHERIMDEGAAIAMILLV